MANREILKELELMGHSNIRSVMEYIHVANLKLSVKNPLDALIEGGK